MVNLLFCYVKDKLQKGGFWQPISGGLEDGESLKDGILREVQEETKIDAVSGIKMLDKTYQFKSEGMWLTDYVFMIKVDKKIEPVLNEEHSKFKWCSINEGIDKLRFDTDIDALKTVHKLITKK